VRARRYPELEQRGFGVSQWIREMFGALDRGGVEALHPYLEEDVLFRFASYPAGRGRETFAAAWSAMAPHVKKLHHDVLEVWETGESAFCHGTVTYTLTDGKIVAVPFANVFKLRGGKVAEYLIYVDASPVFGAAPAPTSS